MAELATIRIDMDKACQKCGEKGATQNGLCLSCIEKRMSERSKPMKLDRTIERCGQLTEQLMRDHKEQIVEAIRNLEHEDDDGNAKLKVSVGFAIEPAAPNKFDLIASISFTAKKVSDRATATIDEAQQNLFPQGKKK